MTQTTIVYAIEALLAGWLIYKLLRGVLGRKKPRSYCGSCPMARECNMKHNDK